MEFQYGIDPSNPRHRRDRAEAQQRAIWASFGYFLERADSFILHYWPPSKSVQPLLDQGFEPQPSVVSPKARSLRGSLTPELRQLLWGRGEGQVPWWKVELEKDGELIYFVEEHEDTAGWNGNEETLRELQVAGVDPSVVLDYAEYRKAQLAIFGGLELLAQALANLLSPDKKGYGYGTYGDGAASFEVGGVAGKVFLEYDPQALAAVNSPERAAALLAKLSPPVKAGDALRLDLSGETPLLTRAGEGLGPWRRIPTHTLTNPDRAEWLAALRLLGDRADRFVLCWTDELPAPNGWRSDYGRERLASLATDSGPTDLAPGARAMVGPVTPNLLETLAGEEPQGLADPDGFGPGWDQRGPSPSPWWWLLLVSGDDVIWESKQNGFAVDLVLTPQEEAVLDPHGTRLFDHARARRRNQTWLALARPYESRVIGTRPSTDFQFLSMPPRQMEIRLDGEPIASLTLEPSALEALLAHPNPGALLSDAPSPAHLLVEKVEETVRWRQLERSPVERPWGSERKPGL